MSAERRQLSVSSHELDIALQAYGPPDAPVILALHGWRDNSASFAALAPLLADWQVIAPDFPGHGLSSYRHLQAEYYLWSYVDDVLRICEQLKLERFVLLGHSLGAAVGNLFAALYPERVSRLVMLDMVGPIATSPERAPDQMLEAARLRRTRKLDFRKYYPTFEAPVAARRNKGIGEEAAAMLAERGVAEDEQGWYWRLDPRLNMTSPLSLTEEQVQAFLNRNKCPVQLIAAPGYWENRMEWFRRRVSCFGDIEDHMLPGGHHQHMEQEAGEVAGLISEFLLSD